MKKLCIWTKEEDQILQQYYFEANKGHGIIRNKQQIQSLLPNKTWKSITWHVRRLPMKREVCWTDQEIQILKSHYLASKQELQTLLSNRTLSAIQLQMGRLQLKIKQSWIQKDLQLLRQNYTKLNKQELLDLFPNRTWSAIYSQAGNIRSRGKVIKWSRKDDVLLKKEYKNCDGNALLKLFSGRTQQGIQHRAAKLHLTNNRNMCWTMKECAVLRKSYSSLNKHQLMQLFPNRTWHAIQNRAAILKLPNKQKYMQEDLALGLIDDILQEKSKRHKRYHWMKHKEPLEIDGLYEQHALAVEYQGEQHYKYNPYWHMTKQRFVAQQKRDNIKRQLIPQNGYTLLEIKYDEPITKEYLTKRLEKIGV